MKQNDNKIICIDLRDLTNVTLKDDYHMLVSDMSTDPVYGNDILSLTDRYLGYKKSSFLLSLWVERISHRGALVVVVFFWRLKMMITLRVNSVFDVYAMLFLMLLMSINEYC